MKFLVAMAVFALMNVAAHADEYVVKPPRDPAWTHKNLAPGVAIEAPAGQGSHDAHDTLITQVIGSLASLNELISPIIEKVRPGCTDMSTSDEQDSTEHGFKVSYDEALCTKSKGSGSDSAYFFKTIQGNGKTYYFNLTVRRDGGGAITPEIEPARAYMRGIVLCQSPDADDFCKAHPQ